jgi:hypothetical protein
MTPYGSNIEQTRTNKDSYHHREKKSLINAVIPNSRSETSQFYIKDSYVKTKGNYYGYSIEAK